MGFLHIKSKYFKQLCKIISFDEISIMYVKRDKNIKLDNVKYLHQDNNKTQESKMFWSIHCTCTLCCQS